MLKRLRRRSHQPEHLITEHLEGGTSAPSQRHSRQVEELSGSLPDEVWEQLTELQPSLTKMAVVAVRAADEQVDERNERLRQIWGDRAAPVQLVTGSAYDVLVGLFNCLAEDFGAGRAQRIAIERVAAPESEAESEHIERARQQFSPEMSPALRARYEKKLIQHVLKEGSPHQKSQSPSQIQQINVTAYFEETFAKHLIVRVDESNYCFMPCH